MPLEHISDTARWVAVYRAMESERKDAIFRDPFAAKLAGARGEEIVEGLKRGRAMAWAMIVRTAVFDEIILEKVKGGGVDLVLNLAAGLDARPWRLSLPPSLRWIDVDLPEILEYKTTQLGDVKPACRYEAIPVDLTDTRRRQAVFAQIGAQAHRALVVSEGLLIYLPPDQVGALATDLHGSPSLRWWLIDIASPRLLEMLNKSWGRTLEQANAPFLFAPSDGTLFFRPFGWEEAEFHSAVDEARRLRREFRGMWLMRLLMRFYSEARRLEIRRMSGFALLERY
jgi:methyltransferase (TIGR00027 family)